MILIRGYSKNVPYLIRNHLHFNCVHNVFVTYNDNVIIWKLWVIAPITNSMIPVEFCKNNQYVINFNNDDMISTFEAFTNHRLDTFLSK